MMTLEMTAQTARCIELCVRCHRVCLETMTYCLEQGGHHADPSHIGLLMDGAEICQGSPDLMIRGSEFRERACAACTAVCERCAEDCERFGDDERMRACAQVCRQCADSCREMARVGVMQERRSGVNRGRC
jgi:hypothetical protein